MVIITNEDLLTNRYTIDQLKCNIYNVSLVSIVKTQKLDVEFCVDYLLNKDFQLLEEEEQISIQMIMDFQSHIELLDLLEYTCFREENSKKILFDFMDYI
jgi:hypothetical protein